MCGAWEMETFLSGIVGLVCHFDSTWQLAVLSLCAFYRPKKLCFETGVCVYF